MINFEISSLLSKLRERLGARCFYLDDALLDLSGKPTEAGPAKLSIIILSRQNYFESVADLPINEKTELNRALRLAPPEGPFRGRRMYQATRLSDGGHRVVRWTLKADTPLPMGDGSLRLLIPESALIRRVQEPGTRAYRNDKRTLYVRYQGGSLKSLSIPTGNSALLKTAAQAMGESEEQLLALEPAPLHQTLKNALSALSLEDFISFACLERKESLPFPWKTAAVSLGLAGAVYLASTSFFLKGEELYLKGEISAVAPALETALAKEQEARALERELRAILEAVTEPTPAWASVPALNSLVEGGMRLRNLHFDGTELTIYGTGESATEVLEFLESHPLAARVKFTQPIRKRADGEQFAITFTPKPPVTER